MNRVLLDLLGLDARVRSGHADRSHEFAGSAKDRTGAGRDAFAPFAVQRGGATLRASQRDVFAQLLDLVRAVSV